MMKMIKPGYGFLALLLMAFASAFSQGYPAERVTLCADRSLYISGEKILFSAAVDLQGTVDQESASRVLYVELITPGGDRVAGGKYFVENACSGGCLQIPDEAITGYYYLKAYTKWMRNGKTTDYSYTRIKVVNPYTSEVIKGKEEEKDAGPAVEISQSPKTPFTLGTDKTDYQAGEKVECIISSAKMDDFKGRLCISVVPVYAYERDSSPRDSSPGDSSPRDSSPIIQYLPETRGISLSGKLTEENTGTPVPNALVNLSILGDHDVMAIRTDESGRFNFALPDHTGSKDVFICAEEKSDKASGIYIDNDFCSKPVGLPAPSFHLSKEEKSVVLKMAANSKIASVFFKDNVAVDTSRHADYLPFYGKPDEVLYLDKYIDLPTVEDYFSELVGNVDVRKFEGRKLFRFNSTRVEMLIYDPLLLIDWVAVNDIEKILAMSPRMIDRIELVNSPYIKGNVTYGGIISFVSKNNDFAGIDLPASGTFVNYRFLEECKSNIHQDQIPENIPDARNTVYWDPDLTLNPAGETPVSFTAPAIPGEYLILVRSFDGSVNQIKFKIR